MPQPPALRRQNDRSWSREIQYPCAVLRLPALVPPPLPQPQHALPSSGFCGVSWTRLIWARSQQLHTL